MKIFISIDNKLLYIACCAQTLFLSSASAETETIRKQYTKILDAYGCLGVLSLNVGGNKYE